MAFTYLGVNMDVYVAKIIAITLSVLVALVVLFMFVYRYIIRKRTEEQSKKVAKPKPKEKPKEKISRYRPAPLRLDEVRYHRVPSQFTPLVITPTTPNQFTIPATRQHLEDGRSGSLVLTPSPDHTKGNLSPSTRSGSSPRLMGSPKLLRTMSEGCHPSAFKAGYVPPHGKIECFLKHEEDNNCLFVQILGKKGHSLSWMTGISNPYIRVTLISSRENETARSSSSKNLNLPSNSSCKLDSIEDVKLGDCLLKFVVLDFDRFSRSEFVAEVLVPLGELGDLREGVTICEELMLQQKVMLAPRGSLLISLCNQSMAQQLQVIILKADGIPSKSTVSLAGSDLSVKTTLETSEACFWRKTKASRKNNSYIFNEKLVFEVDSKALTNATLTFEVSRGDSKLRYETKIGVIKLGLDSSQALEMRHWDEMLSTPQKQIAEWHQLRRF